MRSIAAAALLSILAVGTSVAGPYVTEASGVRWNDVGGVRWNDVGGGFFSDSQGVRWNDVGGVRWNDVGSLQFSNEAGVGPASLELELLNLLSELPDSSALNVVITYESRPTTADLQALANRGIFGGTIFRELPMVVVNATRQQISLIAALPNVRSIYTNKTTSIFDGESGESIGLTEVASDPDLAVAGGGHLTGQGVTIAVIDTGVDATHPDLPFGTKVIENVRLIGGAPGPGFVRPESVEGVLDTDLVLGHGTFVASVAAGTGAASNGTYAGVAPGASILSLSAGDLFIVNVLEAFDYVLHNRERFGVRIVNCSWGTQGWFDPDDPVNVATRLLYDAGIVVVFAAGNHGPAPDTLNPYAVAPWVVGVGSTRKDGRLSDFSSRGIYEELLYHPKLVAPGQTIVAAKAGAVPAVDGVVGITDPSYGQSVPPEHSLFYTVSSGTSFAAPHVAGVIALMLEADPQLTPADLHRILQQTATPMPARARSEVGAGRLDAWAAVSNVRDPLRPFGAHVPTWLDERPYDIVHGPAVESVHTVPAGSSVSVPVEVAEGATALQIGIAWGNVPGLADLDVRVLDPSGVEIASSAALNGLGLFGRADGVHIQGSMPSALTVEIFAKPGTSPFDETVHLRQEASVPVLDSFDDLYDLTPVDRQIVTRAVSRNLIDGRGASFEPLSPLTREELARAVALTASAPQRVPASRSFNDAPPSNAYFPYIESVAGARARQVLMEPKGVGTFKPTLAVRRLDFAVTLVRAAGRGAEAEARAGEPLGLADEAEIPDRLKGFVAVALQNELIAAIQEAGPRFAPVGKVSRLETCRSLIALLQMLQTEPVAPAAAATDPARRAKASRDNRSKRPLRR